MVLILALSCTVAAATSYTSVTVVAVCAAAGICQALGKLSLDAMIQRDVPEVVRTSAFARSETSLQMAWVGGGAIGISLPLDGTLGMTVAACLVLVGTATTIRSLVSAARRGSPHPASSEPRRRVNLPA